MRLITIMLLLITLPAIAAQDRPKEHEHDDTQAQEQQQDQGQGQDQDQGQDQGQAQDQEATALSEQEQIQMQEALAINEGVESSSDVDVLVTNTTNYKRQVPNQSFFYSPNFIQCNRTIGLQFSNANGSASFGIPIGRQKDCDIWMAVQEAQENGHVLLSYAFMCEIKNILNVWGLARCQQVTGLVEKWWERSLGGDSEDAEKNDAAQGLDRGTGGLENLFAQTDVEKYHNELEEEVEVLKAVVIRQEADNEALGKQIQMQRQEQQVQRAYVSERVDKGEVRRASARAYLERIQKRIEETDK